MKHRLDAVCLWLLIMVASLWSVGNLAHADLPVVHAILFYSQTCSHCHKVMTEDLPPLIEQYGEQLSILAVNTSMQEGGAMYRAAAEYYQVPVEQRGVPMLIVGDVALIGSLEIPQKFPNIIENGLVDGGIDWPDILEFREILEAEGVIIPDDTPPDPENLEQVSEDPPPADTDANLAADGEESSGESPELEAGQASVTSDLEEAALASEHMTLAQRFKQDKVGNALSVVVLLGMAGLVARVGRVVTQSDKKLTPWPNWVVPVLVLIGTVVALYMGYVEVTQTEAVCGPVGDCNTVQQSSYAYLFGVIPIGVFGTLGYVAIGLIWLLASYGLATWRKIGALALWLLALFGVLFSMYLTFLEPFVIGASCAWCLTSAVIMALLLWATTAPVVQSWFANGR